MTTTTQVKSILCAGWAPPDNDFYAQTLEQSEWTKEVLLIGFTINITQFVQFDNYVLQLIRHDNLMTVNFTSFSGYFGRAGKAIHKLFMKFDWLRDPHVPAGWRAKALRGYIMHRIRDIKQTPKVLDSKKRVVRRYTYPRELHERWVKTQSDKSTTPKKLTLRLSVEKKDSP